MEEALQRSQGSDRDPQLKVSVLLDYTRGSRGCWRPPPSRAAFVSDGPPVLTTFVCPRAGQLQNHAASVAAALHLADARVSVPHAGPEGAAAAAGPTALQRDHRGPAHQGLPL